MKQLIKNNLKYLNVLVVLLISLLISLVVYFVKTDIKTKVFVWIQQVLI